MTWKKKNFKSNAFFYHIKILNKIEKQAYQLAAKG
jgi:hypothetical protein